MMFNLITPTVIHVDLNSCFATIEQQANPLLRGKPVAVAAYTTGGGCILTASYEAKRFGVKTGMRVREGKQFCPQLVVLPSDPEKYRFINHKLVALLSSYTPNFSVESIDEMVMDLMLNDKCQMINIAQEIKRRIKQEIGEWLTVSIGIAPNRYLAKVASGLHKPDGLDLIDKDNVEVILGSLALEDLCGIKKGNGDRLRMAGIKSTLDFYRADPLKLKRAFRSVVGYSWWLQLHGYEEAHEESRQKTFSQSYALPKAYLPTQTELHQILTQLVAKMGRRLRAEGFAAGGVGVSCLFSDHTYWQHGEKQSRPMRVDTDIYGRALHILRQAQDKPVRILAVNCFSLAKAFYQQETILGDEEKKNRLTQALDRIHDRWGDFLVTPARMLGMEHKVIDRIAFGGVK